MFQEKKIKRFGKKIHSIREICGVTPQGIYTYGAVLAFLSRLAAVRSDSTCCRVLKGTR